jgi:predicted transcriptional regulator of viral defense system
MANFKKTKSKLIEEAINDLPYFTIDNLAPIEKNKDYLKMLFYRLAKRKQTIALKRGMYVSHSFLDNVEKKNIVKEYYEFVANIIYKPSYLSLEYVLEKYGILTETVNNFTLVTEKKTFKLTNVLGVFKYYHIRERLFRGFKITKKENFLIAEASLAKALFDFLYFRKNILATEEQIAELRLNMNNFSQSDFKELEKYIKLEGSKRMKMIFNYLAR